MSSMSTAILAVLCVILLAACITMTILYVRKQSPSIAAAATTTTQSPSAAATADPPATFIQYTSNVTLESNEKKLNICSVNAAHEGVVTLSVNPTNNAWIIQQTNNNSPATFVKYGDVVNFYIYVPDDENMYSKLTIGVMTNIYNASNWLKCNDVHPFVVAFSATITIPGLLNNIIWRICDDTGKDAKAGTHVKRGDLISLMAVGPNIPVDKSYYLSFPQSCYMTRNGVQVLYPVPPAPCDNTCVIAGFNEIGDCRLTIS